MPSVSRMQKEEQESVHWEALLQQLLNGETRFETRPIHAHMQFSNYCNLSCIMCWNGNNPRTKRIPPELLAKIESQLGPDLSVIEPFSGSEPLIFTWDDTRRMAQELGILLRITTNLQFLTREKFEELKDITETLCVSVDSHIPEVLEKIRQRSRADTILSNLALAAQLTRENSIECIANVVLLVYNAPFLPDTLRYFHSVGIESVNIIQMFDSNNESHQFDPVRHFTAEFLEWIHQESVNVVRALKMRMVWNIGQYRLYDFRVDAIPKHPRKISSDRSDHKLALYFPGFCKQVYNRVRLEIDGDVAPCYLATEGNLSLGNLNEQDFEEIWNGPNAQDLRRGMYTDDVPALCQNCSVRRPLQPQLNLPFADEFKQRESQLFWARGEHREARLEIEGPAHCQRSEEAPRLRLRAEQASRVFWVALGMGGQREEIYYFKAKGVRVDGNNLFEVTIPAEIWEQLRPNVAYWWGAWQKVGWTKPLVRTRLLPCLIKSALKPRLSESTLAYPDSVVV